MLLLIALSAVLGSVDRHHVTPIAQVSHGPSAVAPDDAPAGPDVPLDLPQGTGPRATSDGKLFDTVAVADASDVSMGDGRATITVDTAGLPVGAFVELTELGGGRTILALVAANDARNGAALLSPGALHALGIAPGAGIRVRAASPTPQEQNALHSGGSAAARIDAPEVLLKALRKRVPQYAIATRPPVRPTRPVRTATPAPAPGARYQAPAPVARPSRPPVAAVAPRSGYVVQVAALSASDRAEALARSLHGRTIASGGLYRVQLGPYADVAAANRARDEVVRRGYRDAHVYHTD